MDRTNVLNLLGLARRARKLVAGEDTVIRYLKDRKIKIVFVASDASEKQIDKFDKKCFFYETKMNNEFTSSELSNAIGKQNIKILGITDQGFLDALNKSLDGGAINEG